MDKKVMVIAGCRPEFVKTFPVVMELRNRGIDTTFVMTGQHTDLVAPSIDEIGLYPDIEFSAIDHSTGFANSSLPYILEQLDGIVDGANPDIVIVQGDTSSTLAGALFAFNHNIKLIHVESGLRTYQKNPYPEEINRQIISRIADVNCCPTKRAMNNLLGEHVMGENHVTGNTEIDALYYALDECIPKKHYAFDEERRTIIVTLHRRESIGLPMRNVCRDIIKIADAVPVDIIVTKHPNPSVSAIIEEELGGADPSMSSSIIVTDPMDFVSFVHQMAESTLIITDSGGVSESASALGIPVVVARDTTDRPESSRPSIALMANSNTVFNAAMFILKSPELYEKMAKAKCPFGDGHAAEKIVDILEDL